RAVDGGFEKSAQRGQEALFHLAARAVEAALERLHRQVEGLGGVPRTLAQDVAPDEHVAERGIEIADDDRDAMAQLAINELLLGVRPLEGELTLERQCVA